MSLGVNKLICYPTLDVPPVLRPAPPKRDWMTQSPGRFAYRCLPLVIANSHGWELLADEPFSATWNGGIAASDMQVSFLGEKPSLLPASHFGMGVLTFQPGYLFETQERYNLWVAGPINQPKDGIIPLCGVVEADWGPYTFTMNWMFTRPGTVRFEKGEPFCHVFPIPRQLLTAVQPEIRDMSEIPEKAETLNAWRTARNAVLDRVKKGELEPTQQVFGMHYFRGENPQGENAVPDHVTRLTLKPFVDHTANQVSRRAEEIRVVPARAEKPAVARLVRAHFMSNGSQSATVAFPDPFFSTSIENPDEALLRVIAPFWRSLRRERQSYLWFQRRGDRLRIHLHGPEEEASELRARLEEATAGFSPEWHAYRREDLPFDHLHASLATECLARGCDFVLSSLNGDDTITHGARRKIVLRALLAGMSALELPATAYLVHHRDSVLREERLSNVVPSLERKADASAAAVERLRGILANERSGETEPAELGSWQRSLMRVREHIDSRNHHSFLPLYQACHGIANQIGMAPLDEAFLCHLTIRARPPET